MKVTATKCLNGKKHRWLYVAGDYEREHKWCGVCGSTTEFYRKRNGRLERCEGDEGERFYIEIPECHGGGVR